MPLIAGTFGNDRCPFGYLFQISPALQVTMACYAEYHSEFHHRLYDLQQRGVFTDIKVTAAGQRSFECHKVVLSAMSPYFEAMLQTNMLVS